MKFHETLKSIVSQHGSSILIERRIINILKDMNAFEDMPAYRGIMTTIISEGYMEELIKMGAWTPKAQKLAAYLQTNWGIPGNLSDVVVQSIAYALDYIPSVVIPNTPTPNNPQNSNNQAPQKPSKPQPSGIAATLQLTSSKLIRKSDDFQLDYCERAAEYVNSLIEYKENFLSSYGFDVKIFSEFELYANPTSYVSFHAEIHGKMKVKVIYAFVIDVAAYGHNGRLLGVDSIYVKPSNQDFQIAKGEPRLSENQFKCVGNIAKIVVYHRPD